MTTHGPEDLFLYAPLPNDPDWFSWDMKDDTRFNSQVMGPMKVRREAEKCRLRMTPQRQHSNLQDMVHGAVTLSLIDISLFAAMHLLCKRQAGMAVTLELSTQFIGAGTIGKPLDSLVEIMRETGRLIFMRGEVLQGQQRVAAFSGLVRKPSPRP